MTPEQRATRIRKILNKYVPHTDIPLHHSSPFTLLIAVVLSARCTDERVNQITPLLFKRAKTPKAMAALSIPEIRSIIRPCGLSPAKARAIHGLSNIIHTQYHDRVPSTFEELEDLPGVGHKTASVVMSQAFHKPAFPIDTHVQRCAKRWKLTNAKSLKQIEADLKSLFPARSWGKISLQIILFARRYCPARGHKPAECPICSWINE
jgi:endonuclease-3